MRGRVGALIALGAGFNPILTGRENIYVNGSVLGLTKREIDEKIEEIIDFAEIREFIDSPVQSYSSGMQVRLGFAMASSLNPDILLLDEVLAVGDMGFQAKCLNTLGKMRSAGSSFILVSHNMLNITRYCDRVLFMKNGMEEYLGDTPEGVQRYENGMTSVTLHDDVVPATKDIAGTGRVALKDIYFTGTSGARCQKIRSGDPLEVWIEYEKKCQERLPVKVEVTVRDKESILHQYSGDEVFMVDIAEGEKGCFRYRFDTVPTNSFSLLFSVVLWSPDFRELYDWKKGIHLQAEPTPRSTGRVHLPYSIEHLVPTRL